MKKNILYFILSFVFILFNTNIELKAQTPTSPQTLSGSGTFTVPCGVTAITVQMWGAGGDGGGDGTNDGIGATGGGSGGFVSSTIFVTPGNTFNYSVGAGGTGNGGNSTFTNGTGPATNMIAGGGGVGAANGGAVGSAGTASGGTTNTPGTAGSANTGSSGGAGGTNITAGSGAGGNAVLTGVNGLAGTSPGGGGSGAGDRDGGSTNGGNGGNGAIMISFVVTPAGNDQNLSACATSTTMTATAPSSGTGTWSCVSGCSGVTITSPNSATSSITGLTPGTNTVLRWTVTNAGCGTTTDDVTINTLVGPLCPAYCTSLSTSNAGGHITNVVFGNISQASGFSATGSSNGSCTPFILGATYPISVTITAPVGSSNSVTAFIDWNADGDFADAGELNLIENNLSGSNLVATGNITVPAGVVCGSSIRIRIIYEYNAAPTTAEALCGDPGVYGETEDYCTTISCSTPTCTDGIKNGDETGVDCGGSTCPPCTNLCFDGIKNSDETGIDCGGGFCMPCATNNVPDTSSCGTCPATNLGTIYPSVCDQVGTSAYNLNSPILQATSCGSFTAPSPAPSCGTVGSEGTWVRYDLAPGVTQVQLAFNTGNVATGSSNTYVQAYQGTGCGALTPVAGGCQNTVDFAASIYTLYQNFFNNLNPNQDLWLFIYNNAGKSFNLNYSMVGTAGPPPNTTCATAETAIGSACNLGAPGGSFATPGSAGIACSGGNWGSNENTTFYAFTADSTSGSLEIGNISCNDGAAGNGQFGVWTSCAAVGTYGAGFLGCAVGNGTINLTSLVNGQTYYIAADGFAGDNCAWDFTGIGIVLPVKLSNFSAIYNKNKVDINWITETEINNDFFTIERSKDLINFEVIEIVKGKGNSSSRNIYGTYDHKPYSGTSYYRLKQTDYDGNFEYFEPVAVTIKNILEDVVVYPNPVTGNGFIEFSSIEETTQTIAIYDIAGRVVYEKQIEVKRGENKLMLETNNLTKGMYFIRLDEGAEGVNIKFIKE